MLKILITIIPRCTKNINLNFLSITFKYIRGTQGDEVHVRKSPKISTVLFFILAVISHIVNPRDKVNIALKNEHSNGFNI